jgi:hypothetical protein
LELRGRNWRLENNEELLHNLYFLPHVRVIRSRRRKRMVNISQMGEQNNEGKSPLGRPSSGG